MEANVQYYEKEKDILFVMFLWTPYISTGHP